ncbi:MAG: NifB/NifX family molybdenum-iron cluster-binding protein [Candidatus Marinimicrobia bacterium]|nr:NifB/NifX family molybdenum-iron cluster-binding protein [Candidatus Neomarinimicrobiota bacterium]
MKIAFTSKGKDWDAQMDPRFGRTEYFFIFDEENGGSRVVDNTDIKNEAHGAGPKTAQRLFEEKADVLITGNGPGGNAASVLEKAGIRIYTDAGNMQVKEAYEAYKKGDLKQF